MVGEFTFEPKMLNRNIMLSAPFIKWPSGSTIATVDATVIFTSPTQG